MDSREWILWFAQNVAVLSNFKRMLGLGHQMVPKPKASSGMSAGRASRKNNIGSQIPPSHSAVFYLKRSQQCEVSKVCITWWGLPSKACISSYCLGWWHAAFFGEPAQTKSHLCWWSPTATTVTLLRPNLLFPARVAQAWAAIDQFLRSNLFRSALPKR